MSLIWNLVLQCLPGLHSECALHADMDTDEDADPSSQLHLLDKADTMHLLSSTTDKNTLPFTIQDVQSSIAGTKVWIAYIYFCNHGWIVFIGVFEMI